MEIDSVKGVLESVNKEQAKYEKFISIPKKI